MGYSNLLNDFILNLKIPGDLPEGVDVLYPFSNDEVQSVVDRFYNKYYSDQENRILLIAINPGRFGAGVTGIPFTDPIRLAERCGIDNSFQKRAELSSQFVYELIDAYGGVKAFYSRFLFTSVCPVGFTKDGKNLNYYDIPELQNALEAFNVEALRKQIDMGASREVAFCVGKGKNYKYLNSLNNKHHFFDRIEVIPHPRWVMQYSLKSKKEITEECILKLNTA